MDAMLQDESPSDFRGGTVESLGRVLDVASVITDMDTLSSLSKAVIVCGFLFVLGYAVRLRSAF